MMGFAMGYFHFETRQNSGNRNGVCKSWGTTYLFIQTPLGAYGPHDKTSVGALKASKILKYLNTAFFKYTCFKTERKQGTVRGQTPKVDQFRCAKTRAT